MKQTRTPQKPKPYAPKILKEKTDRIRAIKPSKKQKHKLKWTDNEV